MQKSKIICLFLIPILLLIGIGVTYSYYSMNIPTTNTISVAHFDTDVETVYESPSTWQIGDTDSYNFVIENTSDTPFNVRLSFIETWMDGNGNEIGNIINGEKIGVINLSNSTNWKKIGNYYYYKNSVPANGTTNSLISGFTFNSSYDGEKVCIYSTATNAESCETTLNDYENLTYKVTIKTEIIQSVDYEEVWNVTNANVTSNSTYTVNFIKNGSDVTGTMQSEDFVYGVSKALTSNAFVRSGYQFSGWNKKYDGTGTNYDNSEVVTDIGNGDTDIVNLYAMWNNLYSVSFSSSDTTHCPLDALTYATIPNVAYGSLVKNTAIANPTCTGYTFTGWTASGDIDATTAKYGSINTPSTAWVNGNTGTFFKNLSTTVNGTVTLTAGWTPTVFTLTLNNQSATTAGTGYIYEKYNTGWYSNSGATTSIATITPPTKTNYYFDGYYTAANGNGTKVINEAGTILSNNTAFTQDTTLYANWIEVLAENLSFDSTITGFDCDDAQCAIEELYELLVSREKE